MQLKIQINSILQLVRCFQYTYQCFCGDQITQDNRANEDTCDKPCEGDKNVEDPGDCRCIVQVRK